MYDVMLIVDDLEINRAALRALFEDSFNVLEAESAKKALDILEKYKEDIDILLLDLMMPEMSGIELLKVIKNNGSLKQIPTVVITASEEADDQILALKNGAGDYITKPFIPEIVVARVNNVISSNKRMAAILKEREELQSKTELDQMTGLYNKTTAEELINKVLQEDTKKLHAILAVDIDNFKAINDSDGHLVGDHTIKIIADLIATQFRKSDIVGRIGGDEFVILMNDIPSKEVARNKAKDIVRILKYKPNLTIPANASVSIGLTFNEGRKSSYLELFNQVDQSLYQSKKLGKARFSEYGILYKSVNTDERNVVIVYSKNMPMCNMIAKVVEDKMNLIDVASLDMLADLIEKQLKEIVLLYVDVTKEDDNGNKVWKAISEIEKLKNVPKFAICKESNMEQYKEALCFGVQDVIPAPIYVDVLKRKSEIYIS